MPPQPQRENNSANSAKKMNTNPDKVTAEICPDCGAAMTPVDGPTHRYIGGSPACWAIFSALNVGEPPIAPGPYNNLLVDAYCVQHPGQPSPPAIQSVAIHVLTIYAVLVKGADPAHAVQLRLRPLRDATRSRRDRFTWLTPPDLTGGVTVASIAAAPTPTARTELVTTWVQEVWARWAVPYGDTIDGWYEEFVAPDRL